MAACGSDCKHYANGDVKHVKECVYYPGSLSEEFDKVEKDNCWLRKIIDDENKRRYNDSMNDFQMN